VVWGDARWGAALGAERAGGRGTRLPASAQRRSRASADEREIRGFGEWVVGWVGGWLVGWVGGQGMAAGIVRAGAGGRPRRVPPSPRLAAVTGPSESRPGAPAGLSSAAALHPSRRAL
jgi:hypothetical protein